MGQDWSGSVRTGQGQSGLVRIGQDWSELIRTGQGRSILVSTAQDWSGNQAKLNPVTAK